jgi:hypothetical protein
MLFFLWLQIECSYEKIVIFARSGTNAENIIQYFKKTSTARVIAVLQTTLMRESLIEFKIRCAHEIFTKTQLKSKY